MGSDIWEHPGLQGLMGSKNCRRLWREQTGGKGGVECETLRLPLCRKAGFGEGKGFRKMPDCERHESRSLDPPSAQSSQPVHGQALPVPPPPFFHAG